MNCAKLAIEFNPAFPDAHGILAAAAAHLGNSAEARAGLGGYVRLLPGLTLGDPRLTRPLRRLADCDRFFAGLRKAGLPDDSLCNLITSTESGNKEKLPWASWPDFSSWHFPNVPACPRIRY